MNLKRAGVALCALAVTGVFAGTVAAMPPKKDPHHEALEAQLAVCRSNPACKHVLDTQGPQAALQWIQQHKTYYPPPMM